MDVVVGDKIDTTQYYETTERCDAPFFNRLLVLHYGGKGHLVPVASSLNMKDLLTGQFNVDLCEA